MSKALPITRRGLVASIIATPFTTGWPVRAQAFEPFTLAAGAAVVSIVTGVAGVLSDHRKETILSEINSKLNAVIRNQEIIIEELRSLKLYFDDALYGAFRQATIVRMNAHQDRYEVLIVDKITDKNRSYFADLEDDVAQTTFELGQYDAPAYIAFGAGIGMTLALHQATGRSKESFRKLRDVFLRPYNRWLDPNDTKSIVSLVNSTKSEIDRRTAALNARPRSVVLEEGNGVCVYTTTVNISGDLANGFTGTSKTTQTCPATDPCGLAGAACVVKDEIAEVGMTVGTALLEMLSIKTIAGTDLPEIPQFVPSGIAIVDEMNKERIAIFQLMVLLARQQLAQEQIEKCREELSKTV